MFSNLKVVAVAVFAVNKVSRSMKKAARRVLERMSELYRVLREAFDGLRVVTQGLQADDQVLINGLMKVRPGGQVKAEQGKMEQFASNELEVKPVLGGK